MSAMSSTGTADAWEEDWEAQADKLIADPTSSLPTAEKKVSSKVTKAQRRAQQAEFNRQLWAEAESPQTFHFLESRSDVPLKQDFKPTVTVLSRNPQISRQSSSAVDGAAAGFGRMALATRDNDSEEESKPAEPSPEERQAIALRNREEKQRKYEEVRERLFGSASATTSGASSPRSSTPPNKQNEGRGKGRSRGNGRENKRETSAPSSSKSRQLYDPTSPARSNSGNSGIGSKNDQQAPRQPYRNPRGPDPSGRGGFRSGNRGGGAKAA